MAYKIFSLDLSTARNAEKIVDRGQPIAQISVRKLDSDARAQLHVGVGADAITVRAGDSGEVCPAESTGLYLTNDAQPGKTLELYVGYSEGGRP